MSQQQNPIEMELEPVGRFNRLVYRLTGFLGLTTGIGIIAWGVWSLFATAATFVYEESGVTTEEILVNSALNEGLLLCPIVIALGVIILELKKIQHRMDEAAERWNAQRD